MYATLVGEFTAHMYYKYGQGIDFFIRMILINVEELK